METNINEPNTTYSADKVLLDRFNQPIKYEGNPAALAGLDYRYAREDKDVEVQLLFDRSAGPGRGSARSSGRRRTYYRTS